VMQQVEIRNRIVGHGEVSPSELIANSKNWRGHPSHQQRYLGGVLEQVGWVQEVLVNKSTNVIIDGHLRVALAIQRGEQKVPVRYVDLDEGEENLILASLDPLASMATTNQQSLDDLLLETEATNDSVEALLQMLASTPDDDSPSSSSPSPADAETWGVVVVCATREEQSELMQQFSDQGRMCHILSEYPG
jgi:hypothetical protein